MGFHGTKREARDCRRIGMAVTLCQTQQGTGAPVRGQGVHRGGYIDTRTGMDRVRGIGIGFSLIECASASVTALVIQKPTIGEAQQPCRQGLDFGKPVASTKGGQKNVLRQLIGEGTVSSEPAQESSDRALVGADNGVERLHICWRRSTQEGLVFLTADAEPKPDIDEADEQREAGESGKDRCCFFFGD